MISGRCVVVRRRVLATLASRMREQYSAKLLIETVDRTVDGCPQLCVSKFSRRRARHRHGELCALALHLIPNELWRRIPHPKRLEGQRRQHTESVSGGIRQPFQSRWSEQRFGQSSRSSGDHPRLITAAAAPRTIPACARGAPQRHCASSACSAVAAPPRVQPVHRRSCGSRVR